LVYTFIQFIYNDIYKFGGATLKAKIIKQFKGGSMAETFFIVKDKQAYVRKIVNTKNNDILGLEKLKNQFEWMKIFNYYSPESIFPQVNLFVIEKDKAYYDMEYLDMPTLKDTFIEKDLEHFHLEALSNMVALGAKIALESETYDGNKDTYIKEKHLDKMVERCEKIKDHSLFEEDYLIINGRKLKNLRLLIEEISNDQDFLNFLRPEKWYRSHGDFTFQNVLSDGWDMKVIDPRGEGPDSIYYDISKIFQSCHGKYDLIYDGNYIVNSDYFFEEYHRVDYFIRGNVEKFNTLYEMAQIVIPQYYDVGLNWEIAAKFFEASHFISMVPFRLKENFDSMQICYCIGIEILNQVMEEWKNVQN
jgi:hypothetical protein